MKLTEDRIHTHTIPYKVVLGVLAVLVLLAIFGCSTFGLTTPQGPQQQIAYGYSGVTAALNTLAQMTNAGTISSADAGSANAKILGVKELLDQANSAATSSAPAAVSILLDATQDLAEVSAYLTCKQQKVQSCQL